MSFKFCKHVANGIQVNGWSVQRFRDADTGAIQLRLKKNGRVVARKQFSNDVEFAGFMADTVGPDATRHETINRLKDAIK